MNKGPWEKTLLAKNFRNTNLWNLPSYKIENNDWEKIVIVFDFVSFENPMAFRKILAKKMEQFFASWKMEHFEKRRKNNPRKGSFYKN